MAYFNFYALIPFTALLITVLASGFILGRIEKPRVYYAYLLLAVDVACWQAFEFIAYFSKPFITQIPQGISLRDFSNLSLFPLSPMDKFVHTLFIIDSIFWLSIGFWLLNLTYVFLNRNKDIIYRLSFLSVIVAVLINIFTDWVIGIRPIAHFWGTDVLRGPLLAPLAATVVTFPVVYAIVILEKRRRIVYEDIYKKQLRLFSISVGSTLAIGMTFDILLPDILNITKFMELASASATVAVVFILIAVTQYGLFNPSVKEAAIDLFTHARECVIILDSMDNITEINKFTRKFLNIGNTAISKLKITDIIEGYRTDREFHDNLVTIPVNNEEKSVSLSHYPLNERGQRVGTLIIFRDLTELLQAEEAVKKSEQNYKNVVEKTADIIFQVDVNGYFKYLNPAAIKLTGYSKNDLIGKSFNKVVFKDDENRVRNYYEKMFQEKIPEGKIQLRIKSKNGEIYWLESRIHMLMEGKIILGWQSISRDITVQKEAELERDRRINELEKFHRLTVDRELKMIELKKKIKKMEGKQ